MNTAGHRLSDTMDRKIQRSSRRPLAIGGGIAAAILLVVLVWATLDCCSCHARTVAAEVFEIDHLFAISDTLG